ncbi:SMI1/KNR4 family protein [Streptomyces sp. NPDC002133]|uniref:SMI1/KNR4 family protein n=1 Tax=Streptomyces sp. NPDC002133 TaxID=3154409 RepID=UPI00331D4DDF
MDERSLSPEWLSLWVSSVSGVLSGMVGGFEAKYGYPPGTNEIRIADHGDQGAVRALARVDQAAADLVTFYGCIGDVVLGDVGNGYFIRSADDVLGQLEEEGAVRLPEGDHPCGMVIGSDGGGLLFVADSGGAVYRTRTASLYEPEFDKVAEDLQQFLELLGRSVTRFVATGEPGYL